MVTDIKQELLSATLKHIQGRVFEADEYYKALEALGQPSSYAEALVDVFWLLWVRFEGGRGPESMNLVAAIKACWQDKRVSEKQLLQVLEPDCLHTVGLVRDKVLWDKKAVRYNTRLNYTILKYNLLREDSEGYAKLVTLYNHFGSGAVGKADLPSFARELHSLIGSFDLDPNRCLDLLLDAAAAQPANGSLLEAVALLKGEAVGQLMGFKLQQYQDPSRSPAPRNLLLVAAQLIRTRHTALTELLGHLVPSDEQQAAGQRAAREGLMRRVADIGQINLGGTGGGEGGAAADGGVDGRDGGRGGKGMVAQGDAGRGGGRSTGLSAAFFDLDPSAAVGPLALGPDPEHNQPLALLDALLEVGAWDAAVELYDRLVALGANPAAHPPISAALCRLLAAEVAPAYLALLPQGVLGRNALWGDVPPATAAGGSGSAGASGAGGGGGDGVASFPQLTPLALRLLAMLGLYIHRDVRLFTKVLRLVRFQLAYPPASSPPEPTAATASGTATASVAAVDISQPTAAPATGTIQLQAAGAAKAGGPGTRYGPLEELVSSVLLPAVSCCPVHLPLAADLWECVKLLPVQSRYRIYAEFRELAQSQPLLQAAWRLATVETKKVLKRLVLPTDPQKKKEACRPHARMVAKVAHANPLPVMEAIVTQIEVYDNQIEVSLEALKYLSPFSYDVLTFVILSRLAIERDKVKEDGVNISGWLQSLARFTGAACRRFSDLDVGAVLQFLVNTLRAGDSFDLLVLQQIIVSMTGVRLEAVLSDEQLDALAGGPELVAEAVVLDAGEADAALGMGRTATSKDLAKGRQRLLRALEDSDGRRLGSSGGSGSLTLPLLVLTAQQRSIIINHTDSKLIKFIATMYDRCQDTLLHLTEFLRLALPVESYADMLPTPDVLRREYGIDVEAVWHIYRPVMSRLLDAAAPQPTEEGELEEGEEGAVAPGPVGDAAAPREEPRVGDKTWAEVLAGLPTCAGNASLWSLVTPELYATFWSLQLQDIYVPIKRYEKELTAVKDQLQLLDNNYTNYIRPGLQNNSGYVSNNLQQQYEQYKVERAALQEKQARLSGELEQRRRQVEEVRQRLALQRGGFFLPRSPTQQTPLPAQPQQQAPAAVPAAKDGTDAAKQSEAAAAAAAGAATTATASANGQKAPVASVASAEATAAAGVITAAGGVAAGAGLRPPVRMTASFVAVAQEMILPRLLFSATDALYCARFLMLMHHLEVRHFSLIFVLDGVLRTTIPVLRALTEVEANNFGVFMLELLKQMVAWHRDEKLFMEECARRNSALASTKQPYNVFRQKMMLWHGVISATFRASIESSDYTQIANALSVMGRLVPVWPGTTLAANSFRGMVERLQKVDPREDIKTMARSYLIALNREIDKPGRMISPSEYGGPLAERQRTAQGAAATRGAAGNSPVGPPKGNTPRPVGAAAGSSGPAAGAGSGAGPAAGDAGGGSKALNAAAKPFVPKAVADSTAAAAGAAAAQADGADAATDGKDGGRGGAASTAARKRARTDGDRPDAAGSGAGRPNTDASGGGGAGGAAGSGGGGKKQRVEGGGGSGGAAATGGDDKAGAGGGGGGKGRGGGGTERDRDADTYSEAGGRAGSETSGRGPEKSSAAGEAGATGGGGGKEGKPEKEHKEHKRSKDKDREKERGAKEKDKDKDKERKSDRADKEHRAGGEREDKADKEESRREEKERRREEKERERAEKADDGRGGTSKADGRERAAVDAKAEGFAKGGGRAGGDKAPVDGGAKDKDKDHRAPSAERSRDRHSNRRSAAADDAASERDRETTDGSGKRRRVEGKSEGGASPGPHGAGLARGGSTTPDVGGTGRRGGEADIEYDERGGFALPPAPAPRGGGGVGVAASGARGVSGPVGGGGLPPPARSGGSGEARRRSGR